MKTLVVGQGLLGGHLVAALRRSDHEVMTVRVPWQDQGAALETLLSAVTSAAADATGWRLAWCAGAGVTATRAADLDAEVTLVQAFVAAMPVVPDVFFLASSVGGAYGASPDPPPYTESSRTGPGNAYGAAKLATERAVAGLADRGSRVVIGRIANLYGPGQNLSKPQGLISQLSLTQVTRQPLAVYVSLDTLRDYLFAPDAAAMVDACLDRALREPPGTVVVKILASGRPTSVGALLGESTRLFRRRPRVVSSPSASGSDLRVRSDVWTEIDALARTPLIVGLQKTTDDVMARMRSGRLLGRRRAA